MGADASIYGLIKPAAPQPGPLDQYTQGLQLKHLMGQGDLQAMQLRQAQQGIADDEAVRQFYSQPGDPRARIGDLFKVSPTAGFKAQDAFMKLDKSGAERGKIEAETRKIGQEAIGKALAIHRDQLVGVNDPQTAAQWIMGGFNDPLLSPIMQRQGSPQEIIDRIPKDLEGFEKWKRQNGLGIEKFIEKSMPVIQTRNTGGTTDTLAVDPFSGQATVTGSVRNTQSPDSAASVGATIRGQNMTDARARETLAAGKWVNDLDRGLQINTQTGETRPITQGGAPIGPKDKLTDTQKKELASIDSQQSVIKGALDAVAKTPDAFGTTRGLATMAGAIPESLAGKLDSPEQREARSYVFNVASKVINERAGAAQSAQELARLRSFLPAETDNADQVRDKLVSFQSYLENSRAGYDRAQTGAKPQAPKPTAPAKTFNSMPDPKQYDGKSIRSDDGVVYKSNGKTWVRQMGG